MSLPTDRIIAEATDGIGWLTLNNPARRNAISLDMWQGIATALDRFEADPAVRVIVMRGAGGKAFASGADISQFEDQRRNLEQAEAYAKVSGAGKDRILSVQKPLVAMIEGFCIGGGVTIAAMADLRIASETAVFGIPAAKLGIAYGFDSLDKLVGLIGPSRAKEMLFTGRRMTAAQALQSGLVNQVVPSSDIDAAVRDIAGEIAANAPLSVRAAKLGVDQVMLDPAMRDRPRVDAAARACFDSQDYAIGRKAFLEKRMPAFTGR